MSIVKEWFRKVFSNEKNEAVDIEKCPNEYKQVIYFNREFKTLLSKDKFIARSDYKSLVSDYKETFEFYNMLDRSEMIDTFLQKNNLNKNELDFFRSKYAEIIDLAKESPTIKKFNDEYITRHLISEKEYLDKILLECDKNILLDDEQREVVLSEEDNILVIAGAGAGKTTTIAAKVRYLVEKRQIDPKDILVISFTNKAVEELRDRINYKLNIPCPVTTFHSIGYAILRQDTSSEKKVVGDSFMYYVINEYLKSTVLRDSDMVNKLVLFFGSYFTAPYEGSNLNDYFQFIAKANYSTLKGNLHEYVKQIIDRKTHKVETLNNEVLRSMEEVRIANFLYMNNIEYEYEPIYKYRILDANKPYTPDFVIRQGDKVTYIEHFGITQDGRNDRYDADTLERYKMCINDKIRLHRKHQTDLIYTFSVYNDGSSYLDQLKKQLLDRGYVLNKRSQSEVYQKLVATEENRYITRLTLLICTFISNFKTQGYKFEKFQEFKAEISNVRTQLFLDICSTCYYEYQKALEEHNSIDFEDMINVSVDVINKHQRANQKFDYKYIIVDEYQDISRQRYNLIRELSKTCHAKICAVGDDWQSIYSFSGAILPLFTRFCQEVGYGQELKITRTYRNSQELIDIAGTFIQKNLSQIKKQLVSPKHITNPIVIYSYNGSYNENGNNGLGGIYYNIGVAVNNMIDEILLYTAKESESKVASILLIGRYGFDARNICHSNQFNYDENSGKVYSVKYGSRVKLQFLTAHSSKGLTAENVIIINAKDATYGFPSKVDDDPVLNLVVSNDHSYNYAEERRLFYVALTRTKNRVFILTPENSPSIFIKELLSDSKNYPNVTMKGNLKCNCDMNSSEDIKNRCPICGYPMQLRYNKNYGLKLWMCMNDQEVCGFMTNDQRGGKFSIQKCDRCRDGYLIVKKGHSGFFLGCTNYNPNESGCNRTLDWSHYNVWKNTKFGIEDKSVSMPSYFSLIKPQTVIDESSTKEEKAPPMIPMKEKKKVIKVEDEVKKRVNTVHSTQYKSHYIEKDGFEILVDENDNVLTDMKLLQELRLLRANIARKMEIPLYRVMHNSALVSLATERPITHEEFVSIKGIGEYTYEKYGGEFINIIKKYI